MEVKTSKLSSKSDLEPLFESQVRRSICFTSCLKKLKYHLHIEYMLSRCNGKRENPANVLASIHFWNLIESLVTYENCTVLCWESYRCLNHRLSCYYEIHWIKNVSSSSGTLLCKQLFIICTKTMSMWTNIMKNTSRSRAGGIQSHSSLPVHPAPW